MKLLSKVLVLLILALPAWGANATLSVTISDFGANPATSFLRVYLKNCADTAGRNIGRVPSQNKTIGNDKQDYSPVAGVVSTTIFSTPDITCGVTSNNSFYTFEIWEGQTSGFATQRRVWTADYQIPSGGTFDPSTQTPMTSYPVTVLAASFYQQWMSNAVNQTQRPNANFGTGFTFTDNGGSNRSDITLDAHLWNPTVQTVTFSATPTFNFANGPFQKITLTGNVTSSTFSGAVATQIVDIEFCQDSTGGRTFVMPAAVIGITINVAAIPTSGCRVQEFYSDGTNFYTNVSALVLAQFPLTTLGDTLAVDSTPALARVAGNTTTTKKFYTQTGNGTISALPTWSTIISGDLTSALTTPPDIGMTTPGQGQFTGLIATTTLQPPATASAAPTAAGQIAFNTQDSQLKNGTGSATNPMPFRMVAAADTSNSTTTLASISAFTFNVASGTYTLSCNLFYQAASTGGLQIALHNASGTYTSVTYGTVVNTGVTTATNGVATAFDTKEPVTGVAVGTAATNFVAEVFATIVSTANGTVNFQFASIAAVATTVKANSYCILE